VTWDEEETVSLVPDLVVVVDSGLFLIGVLGRV